MCCAYFRRLRPKGAFDPTETPISGTARARGKSRTEPRGKPRGPNDGPAKTMSKDSLRALGSVFTRNSQGILCCESRPLSEVARQFGTPAFVYSERAIRTNFDAFARAASPYGALVCYAMKANSNLALLKILAGMGAGFDIVSGGELARALAVGADPQKIVFSGVGKTRQELRAALKANIKCINVESQAELQMISGVAQELGVRAPISVRVNPDIDPKTHPYISTGLKENKFGIPMDEALTVYQEASLLPAIRITGIDCHIGSQITSLEPFLDSLDKVLTLTESLEKKGITIEHLDLGGGLGITYDNESPPEPKELLETLLKKIKAWASAKGRSMPAVLFEFGRAIVGNAGVLLSEVLVLKPGEDKNFAVIDAAMNDLMRPSLYEAWHAVAEVTRSSETEKVWDVVGPVCESGDWIAKDRRLALSQGDLLAIASAGAYGMSMSSNYNSRGRACEVLIDTQGEMHLIRRRESFTDLIGVESIPSHL